MAGYFQRQLADYVEYHRDPWNCAMHVVGILLLFTGATLPLTRVVFPILGVEVSLAVILALPVLVYWLMLDAGVGKVDYTNLTGGIVALHKGYKF